MRWTHILQLGVASAFTTDYFYQICNAIVITNDSLDRCTNGTSKSSDLTDQQHRCLYEDINYLQSIYACVVKAGKMADVEDAAKLSWGALEGACHNYTDKPLIFSFEEMTLINNRNPVTAQFELVAQHDEQVPFECPDSVLTKQVVKAGIAYNTNVYASNVYGFGTTLYVLGIILIQSALNLLKFCAPFVHRKMANSSIARLLRAHFTLPAMFGFKRAVPLRIPLHKIGGWDLAFPPRLHCILLCGYWVLCCVLLVIRYDFITTQFSYTTRVEAITKLVGYRSGYFAMYKLPLLVLFASKNNILMWATGWGYDVFNHWHRALGRLFLLDIIVHAGCYSKWGQWAGIYLLKWHTFTPWIAAQTATLAVGLMCLLGNKTFRSKFYDVFRATHIVLAIVVMIGTYTHISYFQLALKPFYVAVAIWVFERFARGLRVAWSGVFASAVIEEHGDQVLKVELSHRRWQPTGGTYVFVHFLCGLSSLSPHPFTAVHVNGKTQLYIKTREGRTRAILERVRRGHGRAVMPVWIEGPYGHNFDKTSFREIVFVAGGVGITGVFSHLEAACKLEREEKQLLQNYHVYWTVPDVSWLDTFSELIEFMMRDERIVLNVSVTRANGSLKELLNGAVETGRPNLAALVKMHISESIAATCFFACGPPIMCDTVRAQVARNLGSTRNYVEFHEECFSM